jgi:hypothetical protein
MTTTRPCKSNEPVQFLLLIPALVTRDETRLLHTSVVLENKRLYALRARARCVSPVTNLKSSFDAPHNFRGENPFTAVQQFPDSHFDVNDPEINWNSVAQNVMISTKHMRLADNSLRWTLFRPEVQSNAVSCMLAPNSLPSATQIGPQKNTRS